MTQLLYDFLQLAHYTFFLKGNLFFLYRSGKRETKMLTFTQPTVFFLEITFMILLMYELDKCRTKEIVFCFVFVLF